MEPTTIGIVVVVAVVIGVAVYFLFIKKKADTPVTKAPPTTYPPPDGE